MSDVVLIPCWRRPEFLWHCLENIKRAEGAADLHYIFRPDHDHDPDIHKVIKGFPFSHEVATTRRTKYRLAKQSYSLLTGYTYAAQKTERLVYMIEEDVMVATDFFAFHRSVHEGSEVVFCSIGVANPNRRVVGDGEGHEYYTSTTDYCSLGVCFNKHAIEQWIAPHMRETYFRDPVRYCAENFRLIPLGTQYAEQDGLIRRIQWSVGSVLPIAWPWQAKAYHAGFYGKNRGRSMAGTLAQRIDRLGQIIYSDDAMRTFAAHPSWYEDSKPINLTAPKWTRPAQLKPDANPC